MLVDFNGYPYSTEWTFAFVCVNNGPDFLSTINSSVSHNAMLQRSATVAKHRPSGDTASDALEKILLSSLLSQGPLSTPVAFPSRNSYLLLDRMSISLNIGVHCLRPPITTCTELLVAPLYTRYRAVSRGIVKTAG